MTLYELAATGGDRKFRIGKSRVIWECAVIQMDKIRITRICKDDETGGKPFIMGLRFKQRYANPESIIHLIE
jgi:hypothetical protein